MITATSNVHAFIICFDTAVQRVMRDSDDLGRFFKSHRGASSSALRMITLLEHISDSSAKHNIEIRISLHSNLADGWRVCEWH